MAVKIRLARTGRHADPTYRIVAADSRYSRDGRYVEQLGYYNPQKPVTEATIDEAIALKWLSQGAQYSDTVRSLFKAKGILAKFIATKKPAKPKAKPAKQVTPAKPAKK
jgi:small subunit ribosomal protein S16